MAIAAGDFRHSGRQDFVTANANGTVSVRLNNGDGSFPNDGPMLSLDSRTPTSVVAGKFQDNGEQDIAVATTSGTISVFPGNGDGNFQEPQTITVGGHLNALAAGDFLSNDRLDLVTVDSDGALSVLLSNGDGTFQDPQTIRVGGHLNAVAVGDFLGNHQLGLVTVDSDGTVSVLRGNGDGTFQDPQTIRVGGHLNAVAVGDFRSDGRLDIVTVDSDGTVSVLLNNGEGNFEDLKTFTVGGRLDAVAVGHVLDINRLDIVTVDSRGVASVLLGNGHGSFRSPISSETGGMGRGSLVMGHFGDRDLDDLAVASCESTPVMIFLNNGLAVDVEIQYTVTAGLSPKDSDAPKGSGTAGVSEFSLYQGIVKGPNMTGCTLHFLTIDVSAYATSPQVKNDVDVTGAGMQPPGKLVIKNPMGQIVATYDLDKATLDGDTSEIWVDLKNGRHKPDYPGMAAKGFLVLQFQPPNQPTGVTFTPGAGGPGYALFAGGEIVEGGIQYVFT
jgi:hypothetical protein